MVRIPTMDNYGVLGVNTQQAYSNAQASPAAFGAGVGAATQDLAGQVGQAIDTANKIKTEMSVTSMQYKYDNEALPIFRDLDKEYSQMLGKNAVDGYEDIQKRFHETKTKILDGISDPQEKMMMNDLLDKRIQTSQDYRDRHLQRQFEVYKEDTFKGSIAMAAQGAIDFSDDDKLSDQYVRTGLSQFEAFALENGKPAEWVMQQQREFTDSVYSKTVALKAQQDPMGALAYLDKHGSKLSPEIMAKARHSLEPYLEAIEQDTFLNEIGLGDGRTGGSQRIVGASFAVRNVTPPPAQIGAILDEAADKHKVDPRLVRAVAHTESRYNPAAVSPAGAAGLMQLMPATAKDLGIKPDERTDPVKCADGGCRYLSQMLTRYKGNTGLALAAYNAGPGNVDKALKKAGDNPTVNDVLRHLPEETQQYVSKILKSMADNEGVVPPPADKVALANPRTDADLMAWQSYAQKVAREKTNDPLKLMKFDAKIATTVKEKRALLNEERNQNTQAVFSAIAMEKARTGGTFDLNRLAVSDPKVAAAIQNMDGKDLNQIVNMQLEQARDTNKEQSNIRKEKSQQQIVVLRQKLRENPELAESFNLFERDKEGNLLYNFTSDDAEKAIGIANDARKEYRSGINRERDPLFANQEQGGQVFDRTYQSHFLKFPTPKQIAEGKALDYSYMKGLSIDLIKQEQAITGGKPISEARMSEIIATVFEKVKVREGYGDTEKELGIALYGAKDEDLKDLSPLESYRMIRAGLANSGVVDTVALKKALGK